MEQHLFNQSYLKNFTLTSMSDELLSGEPGCFYIHIGFGNHIVTEDNVRKTMDVEHAFALVKYKLQDDSIRYQLFQSYINVYSLEDNLTNPAHLRYYANYDELEQYLLVHIRDLYQSTTIDQHFLDCWRTITGIEPPKYKKQRSLFDNLLDNMLSTNHVEPTTVHKIACPKITSPYFDGTRTTNKYEWKTSTLISIFAVSSLLIGSYYYFKNPTPIN